MKVTAVYFSPCGSTKKLALALGRQLAEKYNCEFVEDSFTLPKEREIIRQFGKDDIVVVAAPTYAGKLPNKILPDFKEKLKSDGAKAIALLSFGNRAYENSVAELKAVLGDNGFAVCAAAAMVSEHVMSHVGKDRPDDKDLAELADFANSIDLNNIVQVDGDASAAYYVPKKTDGEPAKFLPAKPKTHEDLCIDCGICAKSCPMGSIDANNVSDVTGICIKCHACINKCPKHAKYFDDEQLLSHIEMLAKNYSRPAENKFFK